MGNRRMRATSANRRAAHRTTHITSVSKPRKVPEVLPIYKAEEGDENAGLCPDCDTFILKSAKGTLRSHARGGYRSSPKSERYPCPNSGGKTSKYIRNPGTGEELEIFDVYQMKALRLVTTKMIMEAFGCNRYEVDKVGFPDPVGRLEKTGKTYLYSGSQVVKYFHDRKKGIAE